MSGLDFAAKSVRWHLNEGFVFVKLCRMMACICISFRNSPHTAHKPNLESFLRQHIQAFIIRECLQCHCLLDINSSSCASMYCNRPDFFGCSLFSAVPSCLLSTRDADVGPGLCGRWGCPVLSEKYGNIWRCQMECWSLLSPPAL